MQAIKSALLSFGMSGKVFHGPFLHAHPGFELAAVWERSKDEAQHVYPGIRSYKSLEELLADSSIELIVVNTPNYTHFGYAKAALLAGKHVIVEKPFVPTVLEGEELMQIAEEKGLMLSVYQNRRWDSDLLTVKSVLEQELLGEIVEAAFHYDRFNPALSPKEHKETPRPGTGIVYDLGSHIIDSSLHLFGKPEAVFGDVRRLRPGTQVTDQFEALLFYPGLRVRLHSGYFVRESLPSFQLYGTKGSFLKARADVQEADLQAGKAPGGAGWGREPEEAEGVLSVVSGGLSERRRVPTETGNYWSYFDGIFDAVRHGKTPPVTAAEGLLVIRVIEAIHASSNRREAIKL